MSLTTDPTDPELTHGIDSQPTPQAKKYLVLPDEELKPDKFVRPVRRSYVHVGVGGHEIDPNNLARHGRTGRGCGAETTMGDKLAETYARNPRFYGATYCVGCRGHFPVAEFVWGDGEVVGS